MAMPVAIPAVCGAIPHQTCTFHVLHELVKAVLSAVAKVRKDLSASAPVLPRGHPATPAAKSAAQRKAPIAQKVGELFEHRHLFKRTIEGRLALDLLRERQASNRVKTTETLHEARAA